MNATINYELLDQVHKFIHQHPERHNQGWFMNGEIGQRVTPDTASECGTVGCFAGWTAIFAGWHQMRSELMDSAWVVDTQGNEMRMSEAATLELGLNENQREALFFEAMTLDDVDRVVEQLHALKD